MRIVCVGATCFGDRYVETQKAEIQEERALKLARDLGYGRAIEDQLTHPLPRLARFAMLRQTGHVATRIVDGCEYPTIGRAEWATQWFGKVRSGEGHWLNTQN